LDDYASGLQDVAAQLVGRVHDEPVTEYGPWLASQAPYGLSVAYRWALDLAVVTALAVRVDRPFSELVAWWTLGELPDRDALLMPCGTRSAALRHRARGEPVDVACARAEDAYDRDRKRRGYKSRRPQAVDGAVDGQVA
jgi:hypothetical protein